MAISNTAIRYGGVTKFFHWLTALLIIALLASGLFAEDLPHETQIQLTQKAWFFSLHKTMGVAVFFVALLRIIWAISQPKPGLLNADKKLERWLAETVHWVLYASLVIVPLAGWISHAAASGFAPIWWPFGQNLPLVPKSTDIEHLFGAIHVISGKVLMGALFLHFVGAIKHHVIDRDSTLRRMLPGEPPIGPLPVQYHSSAPVLAALVVWIAALALGVGLGLAGGKDGAEAAQAPALEQVASEWTVQTGTIGISVSQFGSAVEGSFADWTSSISFDETVSEGKAGTVTTTISIPSLTLGSVTDQAMGADFFNAENFPTAAFAADITVTNGSYLADGTLTIKDQSLPLSLPFSLTIDGDTAAMQGATSLDRRAFEIGQSVTDAATLGFDVAIDINLTATRPAQ
ncbi:cytochrome b/b6 domain-containing protein [Sulfitobacter sp. CW3]|uniref:cytochrome b/b6 domain-containing protein n=1 Tax=Sulfitobacter sp. CW3 TaxID=2861965 RepID=UPI001C605835|nr:cytochrome b/b6 domain-containing protein [Sulfitobacter sp. CW3]MBW4963051.1 cytochrome b/b6 domain-containing protein [Sulfitobacter sp. CW3]